MRPSTVRQLAATALFAASQAFIAQRLGPVKHQAIALQTTFDDAKFRSILDGFSADELAHYRSHLPPDMVHPIIYAASLTASTQNLADRLPVSPALQRALITASWLSALGDYVENVAHWYLLDHREAITPAAIRATGAVTNTKWALAFGTLGYLLVGYGRLGVRSLRAHHQS